VAQQHPPHSDTGCEKSVQDGKEDFAPHGLVLWDLTFELSGRLPTAQPAVSCPLERGVGRQARVHSFTFRQRALSLLCLRALCQPAAGLTTTHLQAKRMRLRPQQVASLGLTGPPLHAAR
jgi:hypothetical protein